MTERRRRAIAGKRPVLELQPRDLDIMECILRLGGHLNGDLLALQFWGSRDSDPARRRLRRLLDYKVLSATLAGSQQPNLYAVTKCGLDALLAVREGLTELQLAPPLRAATGIRHGQLVAAIRLYTAALADTGFGELIRWSGGRSAFAAELGLTAARIAPDGIAELRIGSTLGIAFIEADVGTESVALQAKLARYARYLDGRKHTELWLVAAGGPARMANVEAWCKEADIGRRTRLFAEAMLFARPAVMPVSRLYRVWAACSPKTADGGGE